MNTSRYWVAHPTPDYRKYNPDAFARGACHNPTRKETPMKHTREDYAAAAREMYKDDPTVEVYYTQKTGLRSGAAVAATIYVSDKAVERRKGPFSLRGSVYIWRGDQPFVRIGPDDAPNPEAWELRAHQLMDALNAQWRAEKENTL